MRDKKSTKHTGNKLIDKFLKTNVDTEAQEDVVTYTTQLTNQAK